MRTRTFRSATAARPGFTVLEVIVAIMILSVGVLGLAATSGIVTRQIGGGAQQNAAANLAASRFEQLRSRNCTAIASAAATVTTNGIRERWFVTTINDARVVRDSVWYETTRGDRRFVFETIIPCPA